jgi:hypothetical protein
LRLDEELDSDPYTQFKNTQAALGAVMRTSRTWAYAALPALYRRPLLVTGPALKAFADTLDAYPERAHFIRALVCLPFSTTYGQISRSDMPKIARRARLRSSYGSYADLIRILTISPHLSTLGLRFLEPCAILPLSAYLNTHSIRTLDICGTCLGQPYRRRLKLRQLITPGLDLPSLEELSLEDFTVDGDSCVTWPSFPALRTFKLTRTWVSTPECDVVPPNCPQLSNIEIGISPLKMDHTIRNGLAAYAASLRRLRLVGNRSWHCGEVSLSEFTALTELVVESTPCGYGPPSINALPPSLVKLVVHRASTNDEMSLWVSRITEAVAAAGGVQLKEIVLRGLELPKEKADEMRAMLLSTAHLRSILYQEDLRGELASCVHRRAAHGSS